MMAGDERLEGRRQPSEIINWKYPMTINALSVATPRYLLLGSDGPVGPDVIQLKPDTDSFAVFGFSSKERYDRFCAATELALRPYPLMRGHLRKPPEFTGKRITLICVDSSGPVEAEFQATTADSLVLAMETGSDQVPINFHLIARQQDGAYTLQPVEL
jgi:hypothetical protein